MATRRKMMSCLSGKSKTCKEYFMTTPEVRLCSSCNQLTHGVSEQPTKGSAESLVKFWSSLKEVVDVG